MSSRSTNKRSADVGGRHAADASTHWGWSYADIANLSREQLTGVHVDDSERQADEEFAEHRKCHRRRVVVCIYVRVKHCQLTKQNVEMRIFVQSVNSLFLLLRSTRWRTEITANDNHLNDIVL